MARLQALVCALTVIVVTSSARAQHPPQARGDPREAVALSAAETEELLRGMRTYLETVQGLVAALAENRIDRVAEIASKSGVRLLNNANPVTGLKVPIGFTSMSFDTHDKFDRLADKARHGTSRSEVLLDLRDIMSNCVGCHAAYRLAP